MAGLRSHQESHNIHRNGARAKVCIKCDGCPYTTSSENNLEVHRSMEHSLVVKCKLCEKKYRTESELLVHEELDHNKTKFGCTDCSRIFPSSKRLQDHMQYQHSIVSHCQCDYCGQKFENWTELDAHIASEHKFSQNKKPNKNVDIRDLSHRKPCNPASPAHTSSCCDRKPKICYYQEYCRYGSRTCKFVHFNKEEQTLSFLGRRNQAHFQ